MAVLFANTQSIGYHRAPASAHASVWEAHAVRVKRDSAFSQTMDGQSQATQGACQILTVMLFANKGSCSGGSSPFTIQPCTCHSWFSLALLPGESFMAWGWSLEPERRKAWSCDGKDGEWMQLGPPLLPELPTQKLLYSFWPPWADSGTLKVCCAPYLSSPVTPLW